ncbi:MAG TPA: hypothetical protein VMW27_30130 [Thermoanaerobaculia bacterium]|nr:hypothetical protein [Thermoanaerobaculia bacterium]
MRTMWKLVVVVAVLSVALAPLAFAAEVTKNFCIDGTSNGAGWSYNLSGSGSSNITVNTDGVPSGGNATALAEHWVRSINAAQGQPPAYRAAFSHTGRDGKAYFTITAQSNFRFSVGECQITGNPAGCSFNPMVLEISALPAH